jgi:sensor domain CHASE-containing protein
MKVTARIAVWLCAIFALICCAFAFSGFSALGGLATEAERELSRGYAWFWMFLAAIALVFGVLSWMAKQGRFGRLE